MEQIQNTEAMVQDQNLTHAPETGAEQINDVKSLGEQLEEQPKDEAPTAEAPSKEEGESASSVSLEPIVLEKQRIYSTAELDAMGVRLARLVDNRDISDDAVKKKISSIKCAKGVISSSLIAPARVCIEQGHEVKFSYGTAVTKDIAGLDNIYAIIDGQHRDEAVRRIKNDSKESTKYDNYFNIPLIDNYIVTDLLRETNIATCPWKDRQYLNNLLMLKGEATGLELLQEIQAHPAATTKAALHWLTLNTAKTLYSRDIVTAMLDDDKLKDISAVDKDRFNAGKNVFKVAEEAFGAAIAGTTPYSDWTVEQINNNSTVAATEMAAKLEKFFKWLKEQGKAAGYKELKGRKAAEGQPAVTKDTVIRTHLTSDYDAYLKTTGK